ncbi:predicted protein [Thalassiosira pseudonana CCMP1335]|uniref:Uncharacterized protein n=1 Tax=Thalassiosira pseudonana TaxID=35128 RepID=B8C6B8_THAPS|nr:predicted protein [Thalassiosira pseudonana CCMP1335]EED90540.1 predicted protein [Thalassiosira pseudonana CCMP1335]
MDTTHCNKMSEASASSSSSVDTDFSLNELTEEEAMEIWMSKCRAREERQARESESATNVNGSDATATDDLSDNDASRHRASSQEIQSSQESDDSDEPTSPPAHWANNVLGPFNPAIHSPHTWLACERFAQLYRPEAIARANNYIASTPGLAALLEEDRRRKREKEWRRRERRRARGEEVGDEEEELRQRQRRVNAAAAAAAGGSNSAGGYDNEGFLEAVQAARRIDELQRQQEQQQTSAQVTEYKRLSEPSTLIQVPSEHVQVLHNSQQQKQAPAVQQSESKKKEQYQNFNEGYHMALPRTTVYNTKPVFCTFCRCNLYTAPYATRFYCNACGEISTINGDVRHGGVVAGGAYGGIKSEEVDESRWESKMMDAEDSPVDMDVN